VSTARGKLASLGICWSDSFFRNYVEKIAFFF
jgi:hypothetical protein